MPTVYWIRVDVVLKRPLEVVSSVEAPTDKVARGAIMAFGVTAPNDVAALELVRTAIAGDQRFQGLAHDITIDFVGEITDLQSEIYADDDVASALTQDPTAHGIWYRTGAGWY